MEKFQNVFDGPSAANRQIPTTDRTQPLADFGNGLSYLTSMDAKVPEIAELYVYNYGMGSVVFYIRGASSDEVVEMYPNFRPVNEAMIEVMWRGRKPARRLASYKLPRDQAKLSSIHGSMRIGRTIGQIISLPERTADNKTGVRLEDGSDIRSNIAADVKVGDELEFSIFRAKDRRIYYVPIEWIEHVVSQR